MENLELTFQAENQELTATNFTPPLFVASNTVAWIKAKFSLGTNWDCWSLGAVKAMWKFKGEVYSAVLDAEGVCTIPHEVLGEMTGEVKVNLVASSIEDDEVVERMTTYPLYALNVNKKAEVEGDNSVAITPSEYEQFVEDVQEYAQDAYDAKLDAESAQHYAEQAQEGAESAQRLAESARDNAQGYAESASGSAERAEQAEQSILGLSATAEVDANVGTPSVEVSVSEVGGNKVMAFDFHNLKGEQGSQGETGATPNFEIGTVDTLPAESQATASITGTAENPVLNLGIPKGDKGDAGQLNYTFLPTETTLKAGIANFPDGANQVPMLSLIADINPIQDLSHGEPSPTNICPISGRTEVNTTRTSLSWENKGGYWYYQQANNTRLALSDLLEVKPNTEYTIHSNGVLRFAVQQYANKSTVSAENPYLSDSGWKSNTTSFTFTTMPTAHYIWICQSSPNYSYNITPADGKSLWIGSTDDARYQHITTQLGQTVYGGTLDVVTGELVVTDGYIASYNGETLPSTWISDRDVYVSGTTPSIGAEVVYKLATPITVQLTPTEVKTLLGTNNVWADSGDVEVTYKADIQKYIDKQISAVLNA